MIQLALAIAGWLVWCARLPRRTPPAPAPARWPAVSIIVPARDEATTLPSLLQSLGRLDPPAAEIIVVDDHSTDGTAEVAGRFAGVRVVRPPPLPAGWTGKPWACHHGAAHATGELLLFTDADTVHAPSSLGRAVAQLEATGAELLSAVPSHLAVRWWEHLQGVFHLLLVVATGARRFAIGQYLLFRRDVYRALGGHTAVRDQIAEDLGLLARVRRFTVLVAPGALAVRMYPDGLGGFIDGWTRSFRAGMPFAGPWRAIAVALAIAWLGFPLALGELAPLGYLVVALEVHRRQAIVGRFAAGSALVYPLFVALFCAVSVRSGLHALFGVPVRWRGRTISPPGHRRH